MSFQELSDDDLIVMLLAQEVRRLDRDLILERRTKNEIVARYEKVVFEKQSLETRVALLEAENKNLKRKAIPDSPCKLCGGTIGPATTGGAMCYGCGPTDVAPKEICRHRPTKQSLLSVGSDYFAGIP
jgi:hypothetical protein